MIDRYICADAAPDPQAVLVLQPAAECFFLVHGAVQTPKSASSQPTSSRQSPSEQPSTSGATAADAAPPASDAPGTSAAEVVSLFVFLNSLQTLI